MNILKKNIDIILVLFSISFFSLVLYSKGVNYWLDEMFTFLIKDMSFKETYLFLKHDVHPPLYFFILKLFISIFGNSFITFRLFSFLPFILLLITAFFPIRRLFGKRVSRLFILLLTLFPISQFLFTEVRMYSWTLLMITLAAIYNYDFYVNQKIKSFILSLLFSLGCCYSHNYGVLAVFSIYSLMFFHSFLTKNWNLLKKVLLLILFLIIGFLPWLFNLIGQIKTISNDYWIPNLTIRTLIDTSVYFLSNNNLFENKKWLKFFVYIFFIFYIYVIIYPILNNNFKYSQKEKVIFFFLGILLIPTACSILFSVIIKPIYLYRYFTPFLGVFILIISISESLLIKKIRLLFYFSLIILLFFSCYKLYSDNFEYKMKNKIRQELDNFIYKNNNTNTLTILYNSNYPDMFHFYNMYLGLNTTKIKNIYFSKEITYDKSFGFKAIPNIEKIPPIHDIFYINNNNSNSKQFIKNIKILKEDMDYKISDSIYIPEINLKGYFLKRI